MKNGNTKAGGGINSRNVKQVPVRTGQPRREVSPRGVSQIGSQMGNHTTDHRGASPSAVEKVFTGKNALPSKLGNEVALNVGKGGCGAGREIIGKSGTQQQYGPVAGTPKRPGRGILDNS